MNICQITVLSNDLLNCEYNSIVFSFKFYTLIFIFAPCSDIWHSISVVSLYTKADPCKPP